MTTTTACYPWFHDRFQPHIGGPLDKTTLKSGCYVNAQGNVPCSPEAMRAAAEAQLRASGYTMSVPLDVYSMARYIQSEQGHGTVEERVAVGEAAINQMRKSRRTLSKMLMPYGYYGPIHGVGTGTSTAPYSRWAATTLDPTILTLLIADFVWSRTPDFANGAQTQWGPEAWIKDGQTRIDNFVRNAASPSQGQYYWVGPLPGVDPWNTWLTFKGPPANTPEGEALIRRGQSALRISNGKAVRPIWPTNLPVCDKPIGWGLVLAGLAGTFVGAWAFTRGLFRRAGQ